MPVLLFISSADCGSVVPIPTLPPLIICKPVGEESPPIRKLIIFVFLLYDNTPVLSVLAASPRYRVMLPVVNPCPIIALEPATDNL